MSLRNQEVCGNAKPLANFADHRHAEFPLAVEDFAHSARGAKERNEVSARQPVLIHEIGQEFRYRGVPVRPLRTLVGLYQPRLGRRPRLIDRIAR